MIFDKIIIGYLGEEIGYCCKTAYYKLCISIICIKKSSIKFNFYIL